MTAKYGFFFACGAEWGRGTDPLPGSKNPELLGYFHPSEKNIVIE